MIGRGRGYADRTESVTVATYAGLTHQCDDPTCHVPGFVATLEIKDEEPS